MKPVIPMNHSLLLLAGLLAAASFLPTGALAQQPRTARVTVQAGQPGVKVSPTLWGVFYEEINHAGDGGIYAELVQNRAFEETQPAAGATMQGDLMVTPKGFKHDKWYKNDLHAWSLVTEGAAKAAITLDDTPVSYTHLTLPTILRV